MDNGKIIAYLPSCADGEYGQARMGGFEDWQKQAWEGNERKCPEFWLQAPPDTIRMDDGVADWMDRLKAIGNGQVPAVVRTAWEALTR